MKARLLAVVGDDKHATADRLVGDKVETFEFWRVAAEPLTREAFEQMVADAINRPPPLPCGSRENPHLVSPTPRRFPPCVSCGAGGADDALAEDMEARGADTSDIIGIDGRPHPRPAS